MNGSEEPKEKKMLGEFENRGNNLDNQKDSGAENRLNTNMFVTDLR